MKFSPAKMQSILWPVVVAAVAQFTTACCDAPEDPDDNLLVQVDLPAKDDVAAQPAACGLDVKAYAVDDTTDGKPNDDAEGIALEEERKDDKCKYRKVVEPGAYLVIAKQADDEASADANTNSSCSDVSDKDDLDATIDLAGEGEGEGEGES